MSILPSPAIAQRNLAILAALNSDATVKEIALRFNLSKERIYCISREAGRWRRKYSMISPAEGDCILDCFDRGERVADIAHRFNRTLSAIRKFVRRKGRPQRGSGGLILTQRVSP